MRYPRYDVPYEVGLPAYHPRGRVLHIRPEVEAWKRAVMVTAWELFRSGKAKSMSEAMRMAHRMHPRP